MGNCFICGKWGQLERHHVFGSYNRDNSEQYGLTVNLCHACHNEPTDGVHHNREMADRLKRWAQEKCMADQSWTVEQWRAVFRRNYL